MPLKKKLPDLVEQARTRGRVTEIQPEGLSDLRRSPDGSGLVLIDVREAGERAEEGAIPGSIGIPRGVLERDIEKKAFDGEASDASLDRPVVLYCGGGSRSILAADMLAEMGFTRLYSLAGGFGGYRKAGQPVAEPGEGEG